MAATVNVLASIAETLEVLATELKKISSDPYFNRFAKEQPFEEAGAENTPKAESTPATKEESKKETRITYEDLRDLLTTLAARGMRDDVKKILNDAGVQKMKELPEDKWWSVYEAAQALRG